MSHAYEYVQPAGAGTGGKEEPAGGCMAEQGRTFRRCCVLSGCPARVHGPRLAGCAVGCQHCPQQVCDHHVFGGHGAARDSWHDRAQHLPHAKSSDMRHCHQVAGAQNISGGVRTEWKCTEGESCLLQKLGNGADRNRTHTGCDEATARHAQPQPCIPE